MKRKGKSGSPYLITLKGEKGLDDMPLRKMENKEDKVRLTIQVTHDGSKPLARRVAFN
jgi:hypothetical protein